MNKYVTSQHFPLLSILGRIFFDSLLAMLLANALGQSVTQLSWLNGYSYWTWIGIVCLIQVLWGTDTQSLIIEPYRTLKERIKDKL